MPGGGAEAPPPPPTEPPPESLPPPRPTYFSLSESLAAPFMDRNAPVKLAIGGLVNLIPLVGSVFALGWVIRYMDNIIRRGDKQLPEWTNWMDMFVRGTVCSIIMLPFFLPPLAVMGVGLSNLMTALLNGTGDLNSVIRAIIGPAVASVVLCIVMSVPLPLTYCLYLQRQQMGDAFNVPKLMQLMAANLFGYLGILAAGVLALVVLFFIHLMLMVVPVVGPLLMSVIFLIGGMAVFTSTHAAVAAYYATYH